jgi:hypothetical protein
MQTGFYLTVLSFGKIDCALMKCMGRWGLANAIAIAVAVAVVGSWCAIGAPASALTWSAPRAIDPPPATTVHDITAISCPSTKLCVAGDDHGDILTSANPAGGAGGWKKTRAVDPESIFVSVSCPATKLCVAITGSGDIAASTHPTGALSGWKLARHAIPTPNRHDTVACASAKLCLITGGAGDVLTSTHPAAGKGSWKKTTVIAHSKHDPLHSVTCPSVHLCIAVPADGRHLARTTNPGQKHPRWTMIALNAPKPDRDLPAGIDCPTTKLCVLLGSATTGAPFVAHSTHPTGGTSSWRVSRGLPSSTFNLTGVTCPSAKLCIGTPNTDVAAVVATTNPAGSGSSWKAVLKAKFEGEGATGGSCPSTSLCVLFDDLTGDIRTSTTPTVLAAWTSATVDAVNELDAVSCAGTGLCVAGGSGGRMLATTTPTSGPWTSTSIDVWPTTIACPSATLCVTTGDDGEKAFDIAASTAPTTGVWSVLDTAANEVEPRHHGLMSCPSVSLCIAPAYQVEDDSDFEGTVLDTSTNPAGGAPAWTTTEGDIDGGTNGGKKPGDGDVSQIACASVTFCAAVDDGGRVITSTTNPADPSTWTKRSIDGKNVLNGIACPATTLCAAIDAAGNVVTSTKPATGPWKVAKIDKVSGLVSISCASATFCVAVDGVGHAFATTNPNGGASAWKEAPGIDPGLTALSCPSASLCVAVDDAGNAITGTP